MRSGKCCPRICGCPRTCSYPTSCMWDSAIRKISFTAQILSHVHNSVSSTADTVLAVVASDRDTHPPPPQTHCPHRLLWVCWLVCPSGSGSPHTCGHARNLLSAAESGQGWLEFLEGARFESSRQNLPEMRTFLKRCFYDTANAPPSVIR